jgi:polyisoprenoid-binding protein YceI
MKLQTLFVMAIVVALLPTSAVVVASERYKVDTGHSNIGFAVRHMGVSSVRGVFKDFGAQFEVDENDLALSSIVLEIDAASIDTEDDERDEHLRGADFLDVEKHPQIVFKSKSIKSLGDGGYEATGDLTMHGVTKEVTLGVEVGGPIKDPWGNMRIGIEGGVTIDRQDFDVNFSKVMDNGGLLVGDDVKIVFGIEAVRKPG